MKTYDMYKGAWSNLDDLVREFGVTKEQLKGYKVIVALYEQGDYDGTAFVLLRKGRKYYEVNASHCSCYGLEGQLDFEETSEKALRHRYEKGQPHGSFSVVQPVIAQYFGW